MYMHGWNLGSHKINFFVSNFQAHSTMLRTKSKRLLSTRNNYTGKAINSYAVSINDFYSLIAVNKTINKHRSR